MKTLNNILLWAIIVIMTSGPGLSQDPTENLKVKPLDKIELTKLYRSITTVINPDEKCRLGVIYILGTMSAGNIAEGERVREQITKMYPDSIHLVEMSDERISDICQGCFNISCKRCLGNKNCTLCKGTGRKSVPTSGNSYPLNESHRGTSQNNSSSGIGATGILCTSCSGTGKCGDCKGTGDRAPMCIKCAGKGKVYSSKCRDAYFKFLGINNVPSVDKVPSGPAAAESTSSKTTFTPCYIITDSDFQKNYYIKAKQTSANLQKRLDELWMRGLKQTFVQKGEKVTKSFMFYPLPDNISFKVDDAKVKFEAAYITLTISEKFKGKYFVGGVNSFARSWEEDTPIFELLLVTKKTELAYKLVKGQTIFSKGWAVTVFIDKNNLVVSRASYPDETLPIDEIELFINQETTSSSYDTDDKPLAVASCSACGGTEWVTCTNCKGTGYISSGNDMLCRTCSGTGVQNGPRKNRCLDCNGTRFMMRRCSCLAGKSPCKQCK